MIPSVLFKNEKAKMIPSRPPFHAVGFLYWDKKHQNPRYTNAIYDGSVRRLKDKEIKNGFMHRRKRAIIEVDLSVVCIAIPNIETKRRALKSKEQSLAPVSTDQPGKLQIAPKKGKNGVESGFNA